MKRILVFYGVILMLLIIARPYEVKADSNMDGGGTGGGTQSGTSENYYSSGDYGVRITVIDTATNRRAEGTNTIDYCKKDKTEKTVWHFGKINKLEYMGAAGYSTIKSLSWSSEEYDVNVQGKTVAYHVPELPIIVSSSSGNSDIDEIKAYINNVVVLKAIASRTGINYDEMISGKYKILIEPVIYLTYEGNYIAMTAHEAALFDMMLGGTKTTGGALRAKFVSFTHKNLPLSIFLKKKELGVKRWTGSKYDRVNNGQILAYLGIGVLSFASETQVIDVDLDGFSFTYRPDTDVITSIDVSAGIWGYGATCDNPITVQFSGDLITTTQVTGIVIPAGGSRKVWFKWHTPNVTEKITSTIYVSIIGGGSASSSISIKVSPIEEKEPANPTADDTKPYNWSDAYLPSIPAFPKTGALYSYAQPLKSVSWHTYTCTKSYAWYGDYYLDEDGNYIEDYYGNPIKIYVPVYNFSTNYYTATLQGTNAIITSDSTVTASNSNSNYVKSGYGIEMRLTSSISAPSVSSDAITGIQTATVYFPEFFYKTYRRIGKLPGAGLSSLIEFPVNQYSILKHRVHFLPIWYPDKVYTVYIETLDAWTPAGMLCDYTTASINVKGSMWDDWHIGIIDE